MKILLIEDEPSLLVAMRYYLECETYNVSTANNFRTASMKVHDYVVIAEQYSMIVKYNYASSMRRHMFQVEF